LVGEWSRESAICDLILKRKKVNDDDLFYLKLRGRRSFDPPPFEFDLTSLVFY